MIETRTRNTLNLPKLKNSVEVARFLRFSVVGLSSTLLDFSVLSGLKSLFGWPTLPANIISYSCGMILSYLLNRSWVYTRESNQANRKQFLQFILVSLIGLLLNNLLLLFFEIPAGIFMGNSQYAFLPAKIGATTVVMLWNFLANRYWTFKDAG
ncbi:MAG TPA: GtrA family protein [Chloroflexia bacterium]|nr:GtrA family protein [Chloroflexia bacterium]